MCGFSGLDIGNDGFRRTRRASWPMPHEGNDQTSQQKRNTEPQQEGNLNPHVLDKR